MQDAVAATGVVPRAGALLDEGPPVAGQIQHRLPRATGSADRSTAANISAGSDTVVPVISSRRRNVCTSGWEATSAST